LEITPVQVLVSPVPYALETMYLETLQTK